jgi:hypothetical protein
MSDSSLSFASTESFRNTLLSRNLSPYNVEGVFSPSVNNVSYETILSESSVIDSPNEIIANDTFVNNFYPLNDYGPEGGFNLNINFNGPILPVNPNQGEYGNDDTVLDLVNEFNIDVAFIQNIYGPEGGYKDMYFVTDLQLNNKIYLPYWDPPNFIPSFYTPYQILTSTNPTGTDGPLSQDSFIARLGADYLREAFRARVAAEIYQNTIGLVNLEALQDPFEVAQVLAGQVPLIYRNWRITIPENPIIAAGDFISRLGGVYWPVSPIPGDYFNENEMNGAPTNQTSLALNVANQLTGGFLGPILNIKRNPSEIFLSNTGNGQRSALFTNIDYNRYQPSYDKNFGGLLGVAQGLVNLAVNLINPGNGTLVGGYYVGSRNAEPSQIVSPPNQIPVDPFGRQVSAPVYGPSELGKLFEGNDGKLNFGLAGKSTIDGGGIDGQFVWVSPKYKGNAGFKPTPGGGAGSLDSEFNQISNNYTRNESTNISFKESSILDSTQRLIDSADNVSGIARLKHVGNAINQVSKVFNDGYKELTKGSKVLSYIDNTTGDEAGIEYCRVFAKDIPYYTYSDLQKKDGITTSGRRFSYSVLDNTFNLNISPTKNPGSTNIIADNSSTNKGGYAKKYMFSIENLAWRTSSRPGYTYDDLPTCEKGPNGGRVMWFPPYDLKFNDSSTANWNQTSFLGRPEPIYTYKDTNRSGTLSWKIIVDSPSVLNLIVEEQLKGKNGEKIKSVIDSFFAGCVKYDIYELAQKYNQLKKSDLVVYQELLSEPQLTAEELANINSEIPKDNTGTGGANDGTGAGNPDTNVNKEVDSNNKVQGYTELCTELAFYFDNDVPGPSNSETSNDEYLQTYESYISKSGTYVTNAESSFNEGDPNRNVKEFFDTMITPNFNYFKELFIKDTIDIIENQKGRVEISMVGSSSAKATPSYNEKLSKRRIDSIKKFFESYSVGGQSLKKYIDNGTFVIKNQTGSGEITVIPKSDTGTGEPVNCNEDIKDKNNKVTPISQVYSVNAMACRRVKIGAINFIPDTSIVVKEPVKSNDNTQNKVANDSGITPNYPKPPSKKTVTEKLRDGISKKVLRSLLTECNYFEVIKEQVPMIYDSIKEKIKYFNPAFHSMTPEGLNARLTFLNQCVRPGETIPVIGTDGRPKYNDAVNTAFGSPPVLVLRIGDFYNTKIIPRNISFTYEPLIYDLNPEGIGVQPMIANVTLNFDFIGGHGLKEPVERLQNALSFNYYANTEIYDERAVATEDTTAIDKKYFGSFLEGEKNETTNDVNNQQTNNGGNTIGEIITTLPGPIGQTGEISYQKIMDKLVDDTKNYIELIPNQLEKLNNVTNYGIVQLVNKERLFFSGFVSSDENHYDTVIYGAPVKPEERIKKLFDLCISDIRGNNNRRNPIINALKNDYNYNWEDDSTTLKLLEDNMVKYVEELRDTMSNDVATITQDVTIQQQNFVQNIRKLNVVDEKTDGKIIATGVPSVYNIIGTTEVSQSTKTNNPGILDTYTEFYTDYLKLSGTLNDFNNLLIKEKIVTDSYTVEPINFQPLSDDMNGADEPTRVFFMVISRIFNDENKLNSFKNTIISGSLLEVKQPVNLKNKFDRETDKLVKIYNKELKEDEKLFTNFKKKKVYKDYLDGLDDKMYPKGKTRKFTYDTAPISTIEVQKKKISHLYQTVNVDDEKETFIGKIKFNP